MNQDILYPAFTLIIFTHVVMVYMLKIRVSAARKGEIDPRHFKTYDLVEKVPQKLRQAERQFTNLMEIPLLFYIACVIIFIKGNATQTHLILAWVFVFFRFAHAGIHLTSNKIFQRLLFYIGGVLSNLLLWSTALFIN